MNTIKVTIMGLGYIGLPTAALMSSKGLKVTGVDIKRGIIELINQGKIHIVEPDLAGLVKTVVDEKSLTASEQVEPADVFIIAVPTPFKEYYEPDISFVENAIKMIIPKLQAGNLVILESTSPIGTTENMAKLIYAIRPELYGNIFIAYCPERVLPGRILYELENNDRSIGGLDSASTEKAVQFYSHFVKGTLHKTNARTAEMCKLAENSYRDVNIAFANELSMICEKANINVWELINLANKHPRVNILQPGAGVGGHCISVDPWFIVHDFKEDTHIIKCAREVNNKKPHWVVKSVMSRIYEFKKAMNKEPIVACMGLTYKPDIDDLRESPSIEIVMLLRENHVNLLVVEPNVTTHPQFELTDYQKAVQNADIILLLVPHKEFKNLNYDGKLLIDVCGIKAR